MFSLFSLFRTQPSRLLARVVICHDYRVQSVGHQVIRAATGTSAYVTGRDIRDGDRLILPEGKFEVEVAVGHRDSDLYLVRLRPLP